MFPFFPVENTQPLEELMQKRRFNGTSTRLNVAANKETYIHKNGRAFLKEKSSRMSSETARSLMEKHHPWVEQLTLNKDLVHAAR